MVNEISEEHGASSSVNKVNRGSELAATGQGSTSSLQVECGSSMEATDCRDEEVLYHVSGMETADSSLEESDLYFDQDDHPLWIPLREEGEMTLFRKTFLVRLLSERLMINRRVFCLNC